MVGLISSLLGGLVIGAAYYLGIFMAASQVFKRCYLKDLNHTFTDGYYIGSMSTAYHLGWGIGRSPRVSPGLLDRRDSSVLWQGCQDWQDCGGRKGGGGAHLRQDGVGQPQRQLGLQHSHCFDFTQSGAGYGTLIRCDIPVL